MDRQTLRDWVHRFNERGPEGLKDSWSKGHPPRLSAEQLAQLAEVVETGPERAVHPRRAQGQLVERPPAAPLGGAAGAAHRGASSAPSRRAARTRVALGERRSVLGGLTACGPVEACASSRMPVPIVEADCPATEQLLLTIGRAGVLSNRAIGAEELDMLLRLLGPPSERQRSDLRRATDIVLVEEGKLIYWPRTGEQFADAAYAIARVQATLA